MPQLSHGSDSATSHSLETPGVPERDLERDLERDSSPRGRSRWSPSAALSTATTSMATDAIESFQVHAWQQEAYLAGERTGHMARRNAVVQYALNYPDDTLPGADLNVTPDVPVGLFMPGFDVIDYGLIAPSATGSTLLEDAWDDLDVADNRPPMHSDAMILNASVDVATADKQPAFDGTCISCNMTIRRRSD